MLYLAGVGNYSASDDGIGLRLVEAVAQRGLDRGFRAVDLSKGCLELLHYMDPDTEGILVVDCARMGRSPGEYAFFRPDGVRTRKPSAGFSTHEGDLLKAVALARELGRTLPPLELMGIEPADTSPGFELSEPLKKGFEGYVSAAVRRCLSMARPNAPEVGG